MAEIRTVADLRPIAELSKWPDFKQDTLVRVQLAPEEPVNLFRPLLLEDASLVDKWLVSRHIRKQYATAQDVSCYFAHNATVSGRGLLTINGQLVCSYELMGKYLIDSLKLADGGTDEVRQALKPVTMAVDEPCVVFAGHGTNIFGHFLLEALMRLAVAKRVLSRVPSSAEFSPWYPVKFLVDSAAPKWALKILAENFGVTAENIITFDRYNDVVLLRKAVIPTLPQANEGLHPFANELVQQIAASATELGETGLKRIFITRSMMSDSASIHRICSNELALARIAASEFGFSPIAPETMPFATQIKIFLGAKAIAGLYGSGLHNAIFSGPGTKVGSVGYLNLVQSTIGALRQHDNAFIRQNVDGPNNMFTVDEDNFRALLTAIA